MILKKISKTVARHNSEYVTLRKMVSAQAYPREYVHLVYLRIRAQGVGGGHNMHIETAVFFFFLFRVLFFF